MKPILLALAFCLLALAVAPGEPLEQKEQALKAAEAKLACCCKQASELLAETTQADSRLKQSQTAWEKFREAELNFELGDVRRDSEIGRELHATVALRLTEERIEALQRVFGNILCNSSEVRVRNSSEIDFKDVVVGDRKYGDIKRGVTTDYQHWGLAYRYSSVSLTADSKPLKIQPIDYVGETPLGDGKFTYVLTIERGRLEIRSVKEDQ